MSEHTQRLKVLFDWIVKSDLGGSSYSLESVLREDSITFSDKKALINFLDDEVHRNLIISIYQSSNDARLIEYLIKNVEFQIDNLESLAIDGVDCFYPLLDENKRIVPNWNNFQHYYGRRGDVPIHLLNGSYQELIDYYPTELASTITDNLEDIFILNNDLSLAAYTAFIEKINPEPFNLTKNLEWDKIHFLDKNDYIEWSEETITSLFQQIDDGEQNRKLLISRVENFDKDKLPELLKMWLVEVKDDGCRIVRVDFIKFVFHLSTEIDLQTIIFQYCLSNVKWKENSSFEKRIPIKKELLLKICENLPNDSLRVQLIIEFFHTITAEGLKDIRAFFSVFEDDQFKKLASNNKKEPNIVNNENNQNLKDLLLEHKIVTCIKTDDHFIRLRNKNLE